MPPTTWTILNLIRWADERFQQKGLSTPRLDAEILLAEALGVDRVFLYTHFDQPLQTAELGRFKDYILRRLRREPLAYIVGKKEFWSLSLRVTPDVLIPRPETEMLVDESLRVLSPSGKRDVRFQILEIGTGSGAISVALAKELPSAVFVATDISAKAISVAEENAQQNGVQERIHFLQGDLFDPVEDRTSFDLIVTNPPYIPCGQLPFLMPEVRDFEPRAALDGGENGLQFYRRAWPRVGRYLLSGGWFLGEFGSGQGEGIRRIAAENPDLGSLAFVKDLAGMERVFKTRKEM